MQNDTARSYKVIEEQENEKYIIVAVGKKEEHETKKI